MIAAGTRGARQHGFGLMEAIVALVLLAGTGAVLFEWMQQNLRTVARLELAQQERLLQEAALGLVRGVNPALQPQGERSVAGLSLRWQSTEQLGPPRRMGSDAGPATGIWEVSLHRLELTVTQQQPALQTRMSVLQPGYRSVLTSPPAP